MIALQQQCLPQAQPAAYRAAGLYTVGEILLSIFYMLMHAIIENCSIYTNHNEDNRVLEETPNAH